MILKNVVKKFNDPKEDLKEHLEIEDRLFFHDLINQTHNMLLFLTQKEYKNESLGKNDISLIVREIKVMQSIIKDHFDMNHKNLLETLKWVTPDYLELSLKHLMSTYLREIRVNFSFNCLDSNAQKQLFYFPVFHRIMNNIVKNIAESKPVEVEIRFELNEFELTLETKNKITSSDKFKISANLEAVILSEAVGAIEGIGLDSIDHLAQENQGEFNFEIENGHWINKLKLPSKHVLEAKKFELKAS